MTNGVTINITTNSIEARHYWNRATREQLPYGISRAINALAFDFRDKEQADIHKYFDLRTSRMTSKYAMPVIASNKSQWPNIFAVVGVRDRVAALNITGGVRRGVGSEMAVPLSDAGNNTSARSILNPGRETLPKSKWPSNIVKERKAGGTQRRRKGRKPKPFYMKTKTGRTFVAMRSTVSNIPLMLYEFKPSVIIKPKWPMIDNAQAFVGGKYDDYLQRALDQAVKTAR